MIQVQVIRTETLEGGISKEVTGCNDCPFAQPGGSCGMTDEHIRGEHLNTNATGDRCPLGQGPVVVILKRGQGR